MAGAGGSRGGGTGGGAGSGGGGGSGLDATAGSGAGGAAGAAGAGDAGGAGTGAPPGGFALREPANGNPGSPTMPTLTWAASAGATSYKVEVATSPTFAAANVVEVAGVAGTSFTLTTALRPGLIHYWRVTATNPSGATIASNAPFWLSSPVAVGSTPHGVAVTPSGTHALVANDASPGSITMVDLSSFAVQAIPVAGRPAIVSITPDGSKALATQSMPNGVAVIDISARRVTGTIAPPCVATTLYGIAIKPDGTSALMPDFNGGCTRDVLDIIPLPGSAITSSIDLGSSATAFGVAVTPDGATALVTRGVTTTSIKRVDLNGRTVTTIPGTSSSFGVAVLPDGQSALVTSGGADTVKRVSLTSNTVTAMIDFESNSEVDNVAIRPAGDYAVVVGSFKVAILSLVANAVVSTHPAAGKCVAITPDGTRALITGAGSGGKLHVLKLP